MIKKAVIAVVLSFPAIFLSACGTSDATVTDVIAHDSSPALPVEATTPHRADIFATYQTTGALESDSDAPVLARVSGEIISILVEEGSLVEKGQVLALLDGERLRLEMLQAKANLEKVKSEYDRLVGLQKRGLVSAAMYEGLSFDLQALEASYKLKRLDFSYTRIRAPISGIVSSREIKIGSHVNANEPTFGITDTSRLVARLKIPQTELTRFSAGQAINLSVDAMPEIMFASTIDRISPVIEVSTGTFRATAYVDNDEGTLAPGMFARFNVAYEKHTDALVIPVAALIKEDDVAVVYVVNDDIAVRRIIQTGIESDSVVEVLEGLDITERVVVTPQAGLRDGSRIHASNIESVRIGG